MTPPAEPAPLDEVPVPEPVLDAQPVRVFLAGLAGLVSLGLVAAEGLGWVGLDPAQTAAVVAFVAACCALVSETLRQIVYCRSTARRAGIAP